MGWEKTIRVRKSLVVHVIDDFTCKTVNADKAAVFIPGQRPPFVKPEGYRVFVNLPPLPFTLVCQSPVYKRWEGQVDPAERDSEEVFVIRLKPDKGYPFPANVTCVSGKAKPGQRLRFWDRDGETLRLLRDYKGGRPGDRNTIEIYCPAGPELAGRGFFISRAGAEEGEYFRIKGGAGGQYRMDRELTGDYRKAGTVVRPVFEVTADETGEFFLPLPGKQYGIPEGETRMICQPEGERKEKSLILRAGRINRITYGEG